MLDALFRVKQLYSSQDDNKWTAIQQLCQEQWSDGPLQLSLLYYSCVAQLMQFEINRFEAYIAYLVAALTQPSVAPVEKSQQMRYWQIINDAQIMQLVAKRFAENTLTTQFNDRLADFKDILASEHAITLQWPISSPQSTAQKSSVIVPESAEPIVEDEQTNEPQASVNSQHALRALHQRIGQHYESVSQWLSVILVNRAYRWNDVHLPAEPGQLSIAPPGHARLQLLENPNDSALSIHMIEGLFLESGGWALLDLQYHLYQYCTHHASAIAPWVLSLTQQFSQQHPQLVHCFFKNQLPCANDKTKQWLNSEVKIDNSKASTDNRALPLNQLISVQKDLTAVQLKLLALMPTQ